MYLKYLPQGSVGIIIPTKNIELIISTRPCLIVTYNVEDDSQPTRLFNYSSTNTAALLFDKVLIDNTKISTLDIDTAQGNYQLSVGEHTVAYTLKDQTTIGVGAFNNCSSLTSVIIPSTVVTIGQGAFNGCTNLTSVTIGNNVISIGGSAFSSCISLISITIPDSVTSIGEGVFGSCSELTDVIIGDNITNLSLNMFADCVSLKSITIPDSVTSIGSQAFVGCTSLASIVIPNSVTSIGNSALGGCTAMTDIEYNAQCLITPNFGWPNSLLRIVIGDSTPGISNGSFSNNVNLTSVTIGNGVTSIGDAAFYQCIGLTSITIPDSVTSIGTSAFSYCSGLTSITIGSGVTSIGDAAFSNCTRLTNVTIPDNVTSVGSGMFYNCSNLTSVDIPNGITSISSGTFHNCSSLTSVTIPNSVTSIGGDTFNGCSSLSSIISLATTAPTINYTVFKDIKTIGTLIVPSGSSGYDVWMGTGSYYLGMYSWAKIEQGEGGVTPSPTPPLVKRNFVLEPGTQYEKTWTSAATLDGKYICTDGRRDTLVFADGRWFWKFEDGNAYPPEQQYTVPFASEVDQNNGSFTVDGVLYTLTDGIMTPAIP